MLIQLLSSNPLAFVILAAIFVLALTVHEFAHAFLADRFGDPTPRLAGRVTLNPLAHLDPLGTLLLFFANFGWAKPVPIDSRHFSRPILDEIQVALAGPFANLCLAVVTGIFLRVIPVGPTVVQAAIFIVVLNLNLMIFNLLPIPPLDGSHFLKILLGEEVYWRLAQIGPFLLLGVIIIGARPLSALLGNLIYPLAHLIIGN